MRGIPTITASCRHTLRAWLAGHFVLQTPLLYGAILAPTFAENTETSIPFFALARSTACKLRVFRRLQEYEFHDLRAWQATPEAYVWGAL